MLYEVITDGQAGGTQNGDEGGGLDAELIQRGNDDKGQQGHVSQTSDKRNQWCTSRTQLHSLLRDLMKRRQLRKTWPA